MQLRVPGGMDLKQASGKNVGEHALTRAGESESRQLSQRWKTRRMAALRELQDDR